MSRAYQKTDDAYQDAGLAYQTDSGLCPYQDLPFGYQGTGFAYQICPHPVVEFFRSIIVRGNHPTGFDDYEESWFG